MRKLNGRYSKFLGFGLFLISLLQFPSSAAAQSGPAFPCSGDIYQVQSGQLRIFDPITSTYTNVGPNNSSYNATGFNILDNFAYASQGNNLIRIFADGTIETVFNLGFGSFSGDIDYSNNYYLRRNNTSYYQIDIATGNVNVLNFSGPGGGPADVAFIPSAGAGQLVGFSGGGTLFRYDLNTLTKENISLSGIPGGGYGATWTDSNGRLFTFNNSTGLLFEVFDYLTNSPTFSQVGVGDPSNNNDGFSCSLSPFPNLAPLAQDDEFSTPVNTDISGNVLDDNGNGPDNEPDNDTITVNTTPITDPSNGTVVLNTDGTFTYTPDPNFIGVDTFVYEITDSTGLAAQATVTITVTGDIDFEVEKTQTSGPSPVTQEGQVIGYQITLVNTGDIPLTGVSVSDTLPDGTAAVLGAPVETGGVAAGGTAPAAGQLDVQETWTYTLNYTVSQDDIDTGLPLTNSVSATTTQTGATPREDEAVTAVDGAAAFSIVKAVDLATTGTTGILTYSITVTNTADVTLTAPVLMDVLEQDGTALTLTSGPTLSGDDGNGDLDVGEVWTYAATFNVTQDQLDDGGDIVNTATFDTAQTDPQTTSATTEITQTPLLAVSKSSDAPVLAGPGLVTYEIEVENTGNFALSNVSLVDQVTQGGAGRVLTSGPSLVSGDLDGDVLLDADETWVFEATYLVTQDDIDNGADIENDVSVSTAEGADGTADTSSTITQSPAFTIDKQVNTNVLTAPGTLSYTITINNTGNTALTNISLTDDLDQGPTDLTLTTPLSISGDSDSDNEVDVSETWLVTATYNVGQAQIDDGGDIVNTATFSADGAGPLSSTATTMITQTDALSLSKAVASGEPTSFSAEGDEIDFEFVVANTGNTTIAAPITIDDDEIGTGLACSAVDLLPGTSVSCTHTWTATQADVDAGAVTNTANAEGGAGITSPPQQATVTAVQSPALSIEKTIVAPVPTIFQAGEVLSYEYLVVNTGNVTITDQITVADNLTTVTCPTPSGTLVPQDANPVGPANSVTCTATYTLGTNDEQLGSTTNVASASSTFDGSPVTSPSDSAIFPVDANPVLGLTKAAPASATFTEVGDIITYSFTITNQPPPSGIGAALTEEIFIDDDQIGQFLCYDPVVEGGSFGVGDTHTCTADYAVTQDDLDAGEVTNEAVAETVFAPASPSPVNVSSGPATQTVSADATPGLTVSKTVTAGPDPAAVGDVITYQIAAENTGNQTLSNVMISDPLLGTLTCDLPAPVTLDRLDILTCTGSYEVQQSDLDDQPAGATAPVITNTAEALANDPSGAAIPPANGSTDHPLAPNAPGVTLLKELFPDPAADPAFTAVGDILTYRITVTNSGNVTLSSVDVTDSLVAGTCVTGAIAPGDNDQSCFFEYTVDQADIDAGEVENTATGSAQPVTAGADPVVGSDDLTSPGPTPAGALELIKSGTLDLGGDGVASPGDVITYSFTVRNSGNVTLSDVAITDAQAGSITYAAADDGDGDNDIDTLAPGAVATVTGTHALTQGEINAGEATNTALATGSDPDGTPVTDISDSANPGDGTGPDDPTVTPIARTNGLSVVKTPSIASGAMEGDVITYSYLVTNTGNTDLTDVTLTDQHTSASGTVLLSLSGGGVIASLPAGQNVTLTATYTVTQDDIDAGLLLTNTVEATADGPAGTTGPTASDDALVELEAEEPELEVLKTVRSQTGTAAGDTVVFEVTVENSGNVTITGVSLSDTLRRANGVTITPAPVPVFESGDGGAASVLEVDEVWVYSVTYVLTQDDIDAGGITNSVTASGSAPSGAPVDDVSDNGTGDGNDPTAVLIPASPSLEAVKTITSGTTEVGQTVQFLITVENTGNVTLTSVNIATDTLTRADGTPLSLTSGPSFAGSDGTSPAGTLAVGETASFEASYVLTQDDIDAGGIANTAVAAGSPPLGGPVSDVSDDDGPGDDPTVLTITAAPEILMVKSLAPGFGPSFDTVDQVLDYTFTVTNEGNVTLTTPISVADPLITDAGGAISCPAGEVAPGDSITCTGSYSVTQDDLDAGEILNTATASVGGAAPVSDDLTVPAVQTPSLDMTKVADSLEPQDFIVGAVANYTFTTTNTGNVTITAPIAINDNLIPASDITCDPFPADGLAPGESYACRAPYTVTGDDVLLGVVTNTASATDGTTTSALVSESIPNDAVPALDLEKELTASLNPDLSDSGGLSFDEVGDILEYTFIVTNSGTQSFAADVEIIDALFAAPIICFSPDAGNPDLISGEQATCTGQYTVTQDDLDAGEILNEAIAQTEFGLIPTIVTSGPATEETLADVTPLLETVKTVAPTDYTGVDDVLTYSITVTNTGNQTISNVSVSDPLLPGLVCEAASLAPDGVLDCSAPYTVVQEDIDRGFIDNIATTSGIDPAGDAIPEAPGSASATGPSEPPTLELTKTATPTPFGPVGSTITYRFPVENTSIFTLSDITVTDPLISGFSCTIATLPPDEIDTSCFAPYTVTQEDVDEGQIANFASASGSDPFGNTASDDEILTTQGPPIDPQIQATKLASVPSTTLGSVVDYTVLVENPGNVSLNFITLTDTMTRADGSTTTLDAPFVFVGGDANGNGLLTPGEVWEYTASHTITQADINAGGFENSVTAEGTAPDPDGPVVSDISDDGDDSDGNTEDDPTVVEITTNPVLNVTKLVTTPGAVAGDEIVFTITAANVGNVDIVNVADPVDTLLRADGTDISADITGPTPTVGQDGLLSPAEFWEWEVRYVLTQDDVDAGGLSNSATVTGEAPDGSPVTDLSDDGDDTDGNLSDDPTELSILPEPGLVVIKTLASPDEVTTAGQTLTFEIEATNSGNVTLADLGITDTLTDLDGTALVPVFVSVDGLTNGALGPGEVAIYTYTYDITQEDIDSGGVENTATVSGDTPSGVTLSDISDDDGTGDSDPTQVLVNADTTLAVEKTADTPTRQTDGSFVVNFTVTIANAGNVTHEEVSVIDDLTAFLGAATLIDAQVSAVDGFNPGVANPGYDGQIDTETLQPGATLLVGETATVTLSVNYDPSSGALGGENTVLVNSARLVDSTSASVDVTVETADPSIIATKTASPSNPRRGDVVSYTLTFENPLTTAEADLTLIDRLPVGLVFIDGSATVDGAATPVPIRSGRVLRWAPITIGAQSTVTVTFDARLIGGAGRYVNEAWAVGLNGEQVSNTATAEIEVRPEAVFDCGDVIGKVFDDLNGNGHQDEDGRITDQTVIGGKFAPERENRDEAGLPGVRLVTTRGTIITTDEFGRFSVPCAELPSTIGSNFTLKLDPRSLPSGYRLTTENPRVMRLTAGKLARMNFGARIGNVVDVDLIAQAFVSGQDPDLSDDLKRALSGLLDQISTTPSVLRISYLRQGETVQQSKARLDLVEAFIKGRWQRTGQYRLPIERVIARVQ